MKRVLFSGLVLAIAWAVFAPSARAVIAIDPNSPNTFYFSERGRNLLRSDDAGRTWMVKNAGLPSRDVVGFLAIGSPTVLFAATNPGLFVSRDRGDSWSAASSGIDDLRVFGVVASPVAPESIHASTPSGVYNSEDGGRTWNKVSPFAVSGITADPTNALLLYASVSTALYRSFDAGATWVKTAAVIPTISLDSGFGITVDPNDPATLLILESSTVFPNPRSFYVVRDLFVSHDRGNSVARAPTPFDDNTYIVSFDSSSAVYISDAFDRFAVSMDQGKTWSARTGLGFYEFAPSPRTARMLALANSVPEEKLLYLSDDRGTTWTPLASPGCLGLREELCLVGGRFRVHFGAAIGGQGIPGIAIPLTDNAGAFWLFSDNNLEVVVKVVDGRAVNGTFWVFGASLTDLESTVSVTDVSNGRGSDYRQRAGEMRSFADLTSFRDPP